MKTLYCLMSILIILQIYSLLLPNEEVAQNNISATGGSVGNITNEFSLPDTKEEILKEATERGYFTASEYARYHEISLETVYRHSQAGSIEGAVKVNNRWRIATK